MKPRTGLLLCYLVSWLVLLFCHIKIAFSQDQLKLNEHKINNHSEGEGFRSLYLWRGNELLQRIDSGDLKDFENCTNSVHLDYHVPTAEEINGLKKLGSFEELWIGDDGSPPIKCLPELPNAIGELAGLRSLNLIVSYRQGTDWSPLGKLNDLEHLRFFSSSKLDQDSLNAIGKLKRLIHLELCVDVTASDYSWLGELENLEELVIRFPKSTVRLPQDFFGQLESMRSLKRLRLVHPAIDRKSLEDLSTSVGSTLTTLECHLREVDNSIEFNRCIKKMSALRQLHIQIAPSSSLDLNFVSDLPKLTHLTVHGYLEKIRYSQSEFKEHGTLENVSLFDRTNDAKMFLDWKRTSYLVPMER